MTDVKKRRNPQLAVLNVRIDFIPLGVSLSMEMQIIFGSFS